MHGLIFFQTARGPLKAVCSVVDRHKSAHHTLTISHIYISRYLLVIKNVATALSLMGGCRSHYYCDTAKISEIEKPKLMNLPSNGQDIFLRNQSANRAEAHAPIQIIALYQTA